MAVSSATRGGVAVVMRRIIPSGRNVYIETPGATIRTMKTPRTRAHASAPVEPAGTAGARASEAAAAPAVPTAGVRRKKRRIRCVRSCWRRIGNRDTSRRGRVDARCGGRARRRDERRAAVSLREQAGAAGCAVRPGDRAVRRADGRAGGGGCRRRRRGGAAYMHAVLDESHSVASTDVLRVLVASMITGTRARAGRCRCGNGRGRTPCRSSRPRR